MNGRLMVLAAAGNYFQIWQLPLILAFILAWLLGGGYLFRRTLIKHTGSRKIKFSKGVGVAFFSGSVGAVAAGVLFLVGKTMMPPPPGGVPVSTLSIIFGVLGFAVMSYLVIYSMLKATAGQTLRFCILPLSGAIILAGAMAVPTALITNRQVQENRKIKLHQHQTQVHLLAIYNAIRHRGPNDPPDSLKELLEIEGFDPQSLKSPANPARKIGFFYHPARLSRRGDTENKRLLACDYGDNFKNSERVVLFTDGECVTLGKSAFQGVLRKPTSADFAKALREGEGQ